MLHKTQRAPNHKSNWLTQKCGSLALFSVLCFFFFNGIWDSELDNEVLPALEGTVFLALRFYHLPNKELSIHLRIKDSKRGNGPWRVSEPAVSNYFYAFIYIYLNYNVYIIEPIYSNLQSVQNEKIFKDNMKIGASLMLQWLKSYLAMQKTMVWSLVREDPASCGVTKSVYHNYWARALPQEKLPQ